MNTFFVHDVFEFFVNPSDEIEEVGWLGRKLHLVQIILLDVEEILGKVLQLVERSIYDLHFIPNGCIEFIARKCVFELQHGDRQRRAELMSGDGDEVGLLLDERFDFFVLFLQALGFPCDEFLHHGGFFFDVTLEKDIDEGGEEEEEGEYGGFLLKNVDIEEREDRIGHERQSDEKPTANGGDDHLFFLESMEVEDFFIGDDESHDQPRDQVDRVNAIERSKGI